jgi:hypothetical protein
MRSTSLKAMLAGVAVAITFAAAPLSFARPLDLNTPAATPAVPPPPSSIAVSAREQYNELRASGAQDRSTTVAPQPAVHATPPVGFDWASAGIGAAVAAALSLAGLAIVGLRRPALRRAARA